MWHRVRSPKFIWHTFPKQWTNPKWMQVSSGSKTDRQKKDWLSRTPFETILPNSIDSCGSFQLRMSEVPLVDFNSWINIAVRFYQHLSWQWVCGECFIYSTPAQDQTGLDLFLTTNTFQDFGKIKWLGSFRVKTLNFILTKNKKD